jgi:hypothetical protein
MRFRRRVKVFPGFYLNFSNSGISSSIGVRGASVTFGKKGTYLNTSIPGTGLYHRQRLDSKRSKESAIVPDINLFSPSTGYAQTVSDLPGAIKSADRESLTSSNLQEMKETLNEAFRDRIEIKEEIQKTEKELKTAKTINLIASLLIIGLIVKFFKDNVQRKIDYLTDLQTQLASCKVDIDIILDEDFKTKYDQLKERFKILLHSDIIWDITSQVSNDSFATRSAATASITRRKVNFKFDNIDIVKSSYSALHFENANGDDLFIYPAFVIMTKNKTDFALIDLKELNMQFITLEFIEQERIPRDTLTVGETWAKVNKNGQPDRRFKDNYKIPIVKYGQMDLVTKTGLNESYCVSNHDNAEAFVERFNEYKASLC